MPELVAAICDYLPEWSGFFGVYHLTNGRVDWQATVDVEPSEQAIHEIRILYLPEHRNIFFEVYGITHMGNGCLYLYELEGVHLICRLEVPAVDFNPDLVQLRNGRLEPEYRDVNGDGFVDLILTGVLEDWGEKGETLLSSIPCRRVCLWNSSLGRFIEDQTRRVGFESSD